MSRVETHELSKEGQQTAENYKKIFIKFLEEMSNNKYISEFNDKDIYGFEDSINTLITLMESTPIDSLVDTTIEMHNIYTGDRELPDDHTQYKSLEFKQLIDKMICKKTTTDKSVEYEFSDNKPEEISFRGINNLMKDLTQSYNKLEKQGTFNKKMAFYEKLCKGIYAYAKMVGEENRLPMPIEKLKPDDNYWTEIVKVFDSKETVEVGGATRTGGKSKKLKNKKNIKKLKTKRSKS